MAEEIAVGPDDIDTLAGKLDALEAHLTDRERAILLLVFRLAGEELSGESDEVEGFSLRRPYVLGSAGDGSVSQLAVGFQKAFRSGGPANFGAIGDREIILTGGRAL